VLRATRPGLGWRSSQPIIRSRSRARGRCLVGSVAGSISVCGPVDRFDAATVEALKPLVRAAAAEISGAMRR
jgi:DNA-binding IclR family transcriptional regulator